MFKTTMGIYVFIVMVLEIIIIKFIKLIKNN